MNIILCGLPKTGKTTIGKKIAKQLNWNFIDTDHIIEKLYHQKKNNSLSCREIFQKEGESYFRHLEKEAITNLKDCESCIISLGGGAMLNSENIKYLKMIGNIVYLKTPLEILLKRVKEDIPAYLDQNNPMSSYKKLADERSSIYEENADFIINTDQYEEFFFKIIKEGYIHGK